MLRGRVRTTRYLYDDPEHPTRVTGAITSPEWTDEDRCLLIGLAEYEKTLCPGCGLPIESAWHSDMDGWYEATEVVCHACTTRRPEGQQAAYSIIRDTTTPEARERMPAFELGRTTSEPDLPPH